MKYREEYLLAPRQARLLADWKDLLNRYDVLLLDTETPHKNSSDVFETAVINTRHTSRKDPLINNLVIPTQDINPCRRWNRGITIDQMRKKKRAQPFSAMAIQLQQQIESASVICIYKKTHDPDVLRWSAKHHEVEGEWIDLLARKSRCIMSDYTLLYGKRAPHHWRLWHHKLTKAAEREGVSTKGAHHALRDCEIMLRVMRKIVARGRAAR